MFKRYLVGCLLAGIFAGIFALIFSCPPLAGAQGVESLSVPAADQSGVDSYTKLMLHADGSDQGTSFTDSETTPKTVTNTESYDSYTKLMLHMDNNVTDSAAGKTVTNNNATFSSSVYKMGGYSGVFNGNNGMSFRPLGAYVFLLFNFRGLHPLLYSDGLSGLKQEVSVPRRRGLGGRGV